MYRIPLDLDLSPAVGESITQFRVGQYDLQFKLGDIKFVIQSPIKLHRDGIVIAHWIQGKWPDPGFYEIMNTKLIRFEVVNDRLFVFEFDNGIEMHLEDSFDQYESMEIWFKGNPSPVII